MKIFIAGPRAIPNLNESIKNRLKSICEKNHTVLIGDAIGVDKAVQEFFSAANYNNVIVYATNGKARNNLGKWPIESIHAPKNARGFDFYAVKDRAMAGNADYGFMIWNGESKGTLSNIVNLLNENKITLLYFIPQNSFLTIDSFDELDTLMKNCNASAREFVNLSRTHQPDYTLKQMSLF